ncbi:MAG TPA: hypothetical protein PLX79_01505 [Candidatus Dojkabacteria bacterium]|nr:hypothetical protein [Candidatus Dojkabacteria bacterium]
MEQIRIIDGTAPVLFSAPHNFRHFRPNLDNKIKMLEENTTKLVEDLCSKTSAWGIFSIDDLDYDPNYDSEKNNPYKSEIRQLYNAVKFSYLIDIHGILDNDRYDLNILYKRGFPRSAQLAYDVKKSIERQNLLGCNIVINNFIFDNGESISDFVCNKLRFPAIQLEISKSIRDDSVLYDQLINNLSLFVKNNA